MDEFEDHTEREDRRLTDDEMTREADRAALRRQSRDGQADSLVHACPPRGRAVTPCCGRSPFELPRTDRMTRNPALVTCEVIDRG